MSNETASEVSMTEKARQAVRERYGTIARSNDNCCTGDHVDTNAGNQSCCDTTTSGTGSERLGYDDQDIAAVAEGADLGLGCGNPGAFANMRHGETVLDLGAGAGFDCFLAAQEVGTGGRVIGVDMTPDMVSKARENVSKNDVSNVEFRLGEIAHLPVADEIVDVIISNCVINLAPEKRQVFADSFRVLKPGGRIAISDVVQTAPFPDDVESDPSFFSRCVTGAATIESLDSMLSDVGFEEIVIEPTANSSEFISDWDETRDLSTYLVSATIQARKP